ncbi:MAG: 5'-nucleotidase C-terminal domain-containing protein [Gemmatimonadota bacterium]
MSTRMLPSLRTSARRSLAALALLAAATGARAQDGRPAFSVIQLNDVYRIDAVENGRAGGLGRIATLAERTRRSTGAPVMIFHAGDFIAPSLESRYFAGIQMIDAMNFLHARAPLLAVPGNHEFDERRPAMLTGAINASRFPWLAANVRLNTGDAAADRRFLPDTIVTVGGMRVGVFSVTFLDSPRDYAVADTAVVAIADRKMTELERRGAEAIVALTHLDLAQDRRIAALKRTHPRLLWVAGGHEHFLIHDPATDSTALITKGDSNARRVWRVAFSRRGGQPAVSADSVTIDASIPVDPAYQAQIVERYRTAIREKVPFFDARIGTSTTPLNGTEETVRDAESSWGNYLTDVMRGAFPDVPADVAVLNGGAIRIDDTFEGPIRWEHLARTFGFPTRVGLVWLRGRDVRQLLLEQGVSGGRGEGRFLQVSGLRFTFDRSKRPGERVTKVEVRQGDGWAPLDDNRVYTVAVPDYIYGGGDGYHFKDRAIMTVPPGPDVRLMVFDALSAAYARGESIAPKVEGRITEIR